MQPSTPLTKTCTSCGSEKEVSQFPGHHTAKDGRSSRCSACYAHTKKDPGRKYDHQIMLRCTKQQKAEWTEMAKARGTNLNDLLRQLINDEAYMRGLI